jgi:AraC-like DNA-binding protein
MSPGGRPADLGVAGRSTVLALAIPHLLTHLASSGVDASPIRGLPGIRGKDLDDPDLRLPDAVAREAWRVATEITHDDTLGLHMARGLPPGAMDLLEYAFRASPTLGQGFSELERYGRLLSDRAAAHLRHEGDTLVVTLGSEGEEPMLRQRAEFSLALGVRLARQATDTSFAPVGVDFAHRPPESLVEHRQFYRARLQFDQPANRLLISRSDADRPLRGNDPALIGIVRRRLDRLLAERPAEGDSTSAAVRRLLLERLDLGDPTAAAVARDLGLSARTLNRRLRAEGTWFRGILDAVRGERATALLCDPAVGIGEIAFVLGYSEPTAFHRSFKRWTGQTPLAFRRAARAAA